jgi:hypothetical protein
MLIGGLLLAIFMFPGLLVFGFGGLCHLISRLPGGNDRKDCRL